MLCIHLTNWLLNNKSERKVIYLMSHKFQASELLLDNIRKLLSHYAEHKLIVLDKSNKKEIKLNNGNHIFLISNVKNNGWSISNKIRTKFSESSDLINKENLPYALIVDNAAYIDNLNYDISFFMDNTNVKQIILCSAFNDKINYFYDNIHSQAGDTNAFKAFTYKWNLNPRFNNSGWYESMKHMNPNGYKAEIDLERTYYDIKIKEKNKSEIKPIRFDNEMLNGVGKRLVQTDKNLSDYIRSLIEKDLKENLN